MAVSLLAMLGIIGAIAITLGLRGRRIDNHPWCRKCRYDLSGLDSPVACPECGALLNERRAIRIGQRRRRPIVIVVGSLLLAVWLILTLIVASPKDWTPHKPIWLLLIEERHGSADRADVARDEFLRRLGTGELSDSEIARIAEVALAAQADFETTWDVRWGNFIEDAWMGGRLSDDQAFRFFMLGFEASFNFDIRQRARKGQPIPIHYTTTSTRLGPSDDWRGASRPMAWIHVVVLQGDEELWKPWWNRPIINVNRRAGRSGGGLKIDAPLDQGSHELTLLHRFEVRYPYPSGEPWPDPEPPPLFSWERRDPITIEIVPEEEPIIALVADPSLAQAVRNAISITIVKGEYEDKWHVHIGGSVEIERSPVDVSFDIIARFLGQEQTIGGIAARAGKQFLTGSARIEHPRAIWPEARFVDVIFRANPEHAERTPDIDEIWDGAILIESVPVIGPPYPGDPDWRDP